MVVEKHKHIIANTKLKTQNQYKIQSQGFPYRFKEHRNETEKLPLSYLLREKQISERQKYSGMFEFISLNPSSNKLIISLSR